MNYSVRCTKTRKGERLFTVGKIYEVTERGIICDDGTRFSSFTLPHGKHDINALNKWFNACHYEFEMATDHDIERVIFNDPTTIILWKDGAKTVAKAVKGDGYDPEKGFAIAYAKKFGGKTFREDMQKWCAPVVEAKAKNDPLTYEELMNMDGKKVWVESLDSHCKPSLDDDFGGWHTVDTSKRRLVDDIGAYYDMFCINEPYGYRAYLTKPTRKEG